MIANTKNRLSIQKLLPKILPLLIIILASLLPVAIWFRKGFEIGGGETGMPFYNTLKLFNLTRYAWLGIGLGGSVPYTTIGSLLYAIASIFSRLGVPNFMIQAATYFISLSVGGLSIYIITLKEVTDNRPLPATIAGLFYMFNPFVMNAVWHRFINAVPFLLALLPLALLLFIRGLKLRQLRYVIYLSLALLLFSFSFSHIPYLGVTIIVLSSYLVFFVLVNIRDRRRLQFALSFSALLAVLWTLLNAWWLLQFPATLGFAAATSYAAQPSTAEALASTPLIYTSRLIHHFYTYIETNYKAIFSSVFFEIIAFLIPLFVFSSLLTEKKKSKNFLYFAGLSIAGIFLAKGSAPPLGRIVAEAFARIRPLFVFRDAFTKLGFIVLLGYAPLFGIGVSNLYEQIKKHSIALASLALTVSLFLIIGVYVWPIWTGMVFTSPYKPANNPEIASCVEVPSYYEEANSWIEKQARDTRIITFPLVGEAATYKWRIGYTGGNLGTVLFDNTVISGVASIAPHDTIITTTLEGALLNNKTTFSKIAGLLNAKYIVVHRDMDYKTRQLTPPSKIIHALKPNKPAKTFGQLDIYELDNRYFLPRIYAATKPLLLTQKNSGSLLKAVEDDNLPLNGKIFLPSTSIETVRETKELNQKGEKPEVNFKKVNTTKYRVTVKNASHPFYLVFSESYHPRWKAYEGRTTWLQALQKKPIEERKHERANGYANAWYIDKKGDFEMTLFFWPQSLVYLGTIISVITFIVSSAILIYSWRRKWIFAQRQ